MGVSPYQFLQAGPLLILKEGCLVLVRHIQSEWLPSSQPAEKRKTGIGNEFELVFSVLKFELIMDYFNEVSEI